MILQLSKSSIYSTKPVPEQMTISIGTVFSTGDTRNISLVMTEADKALREAKSEGGNKVIIHHI
ncbi:diguanylate cyclase [Escherichia coli]|uniref:diguanylate cyclase domain-containing protein n=1 Tax=Escherichia coli TaxID=562 RepID=UPI0028D9804D|nr:diguanylate cyclase [Escherichia coli]MDT8553520.1 diguanylate cyclase [Escherichia coli]